jgi:hypothetical protein
VTIARVVSLAHTNHTYFREYDHNCSVISVNAFTDSQHTPHTIYLPECCFVQE